MSGRFSVALVSGLLVAVTRGTWAATPLKQPARCSPTVFAAVHRSATPGRMARRSKALDASPRGPGLILAGAGLFSLPPGTPTWLGSQIGQPGGGGGKIVILNASGGPDDRNALSRAGRFASVREILIPPCAPPTAVNAMATFVRDADVVLFAGGDQAHYANWKGDALLRAVRGVYAGGGFVGGGSAGLAIQGALGYDSVAADRLHPGDDNYAVTTQNALHDPFEAEISFSHLFAWPALADTITDTHFVVRNRFGRLVAFLARIVHDGLGPTPYYGLGVDQGSVVLVDRSGMATVRAKPGSRGAYLVRLDGPVAMQRGQPLRAVVDVAHIGRDGERFDLLHKRPGVAWTRVRVDGAHAPSYRPDPYTLGR